MDSYLVDLGAALSTLNSLTIILTMLAGVAIGMAWSGLLSNFAAGIFMVFLKPIKVGDFVTAGGVTGTVREIASVRLFDVGPVTFPAYQATSTEVAKRSLSE